MNGTAARLDLSVWRNDDTWEFPLRVIGPDLTGVALVAQIRPGGDVPGAPLVNLATVTNGNAEGVRLAGVTDSDGGKVNDVRIRLNKTTRQALPYAGELGDAAVLQWGFLIAGITRLQGNVYIPAQVYGSDNAPVAREPGRSAPQTGLGSASGATLIIAQDGGATLVIDGADLVGVLAERASQAAELAEAAADHVSSLEDAINALTANNVQIINDRYASASIIDRATGAVIVGVLKDGGVEIPGLRSNAIQVLAPTTGESIDMVEGIVDRTTGLVIQGVKPGRGAYTPAGELDRWQRAGFAVVTDPSYATTAGIVGAGQSNAFMSLLFGQTTRTPYPAWGQYPPGYTGPLDPPAKITTSTARSEFRTLFGIGPAGTALPDRLRNVFADDGSGQTINGCEDSETAYRAMGLRLLNRFPGSQWLASAANAEGGRSMSYLSCPTPAQIMAGVMPTSQGNVPIPQTSAEYLNLQAGGTFADLWQYSDAQCATRFYAGARAHASQAHLLVLEGRRYFVPVIDISHGEDHSDGAAYRGLLRQYVLDLRRMCREITQQTVDPLVIFTIPGSSDFYQVDGSAGYEAWKASGYDHSYEPGQPNSQYKPDDQRSSDCWDQILDMRALSDTMSGVCIGYARQWRETNIHSQPYVMRENGEYTAQLLIEAALRPVGRAPSFAITGARISGSSVYVTVRTPLGEAIAFKAPTATGKMTARPGMAYGFQYEVPDGNGWTAVPLAEADVTIVDASTIRITPSVMPAGGHRLSYIVGSRTGAVVTATGPAGIFNFEDGQPDVLAHRLLNHRQLIF